MKIAKSQLNNIAAVLEEAQNEIRVTIKNAFLAETSKEVMQNQVDIVIARAIKRIYIVQLAKDSKRSLLNFAVSQYLLWKSLKVKPKAILFLSAMQEKSFITRQELAAKGQLIKEISKAFDLPLSSLTGKTTPSFITDVKGVPLSRYYKDVWQENVKPTLDRLMNEVALDPNDFTGRNSLRNLAEMEVRYNEHLNQISNLKESGVKLVVASSHADCSGRCAQWQGRVYSLDGTSGVTAQGHKYVPLEEATDVYYTTKAGRTYKNGLLGFNCRHYLSEYKGALLPTVSAKTRKSEYAITLKQRELERAVRKKRVEALMLKDINKIGYEKAQAEAGALYGKYKKYCRQNERAYYPMRVAI